MKNATMILVIVFSCCNLYSQSYSLSDIDKRVLYSKTIQNHISFVVIDKFKSNEKQNQSEFVRVDIPDSNQYYTLFFNVLNQRFINSDYYLIEVSGLSTVYTKRIPQNEFDPPFMISSTLHTRNKALLAYNPSNRDVLYLSGPLNLSDVTSYYFRDSITQETLETYTLIRFYEYEPNCIKIVKNKDEYIISFKTFNNQEKYFVYKKVPSYFIEKEY
jgi:hypothetical protein